MMQQPNIVFIHCHDLGRHLGCYGRDVETPNVDALADAGMQFTNYFATSPTCSPSRGCLMTGRYPHANGLMGLIHRGWRLNEDEIALPEYLRQAGYTTHLFGVQHVSPSPREIGYEDADIASGQAHAHSVVEAFEDRSLALADEAPFFASLGFFEPHRPLRQSHVPEEAYQRYEPDDLDLPGYLPDEPSIRKDLAEFKGLITGAVDPAVGRVREVLADTGLDDDTLIVFTADHGIPFPGAKCTCYDAGLEIPLIVSQPGEIERGAISDALLSNVDFLPTILEFLGLEIPDRIQGRSFAPILEGHQRAGRERIFAEQTYHVIPNPSRAIRTSDHKYIQNYLTHFPTQGPTLGPDAKPPERSDEELYAVAADPTEQRNLIDSEPFETGGPEEWSPGLATNEAPLVDLREDLSAWMAETADPLIEGCLPLPTRERARLTPSG